MLKPMQAFPAAFGNPVDQKPPVISFAMQQAKSMQPEQICI